MRFVVYRLLFEDGSVYIGATHAEVCRRRKHEDGALLYAGKVNFQFAVLTEYPTEDAMYAGEIETVRDLKKAGAILRNKAGGGRGGNLGTTRRHSTETREKISRAKKFRPLGLRRLTESQLQAAYERHCNGVRPADLAKELNICHGSLTGAWRRRGLEIFQWPRHGRKLSAETRARMSAAKLGHGVSAETREKIAATKRGIPRSAECRAKISASLLTRAA